MWPTIKSSSLLFKRAILIESSIEEAIAFFTGGLGKLISSIGPGLCSIRISEALWSWAKYIETKVSSLRGTQLQGEHNVN